MGGGVMRAGTKLTGGIRGISVKNLQVYSPARRAASVRPASATLSSVEEVKLVASRAEKTCSEIDDWVFTGGEEKVITDSGESLPRVVFDGVPTLQESKEATSDLTVALEKIYLSPHDSIKHVNSTKANHDSRLSVTSSQVEKSKVCNKNEIARLPAVGSSAVKAFRLLHESPAAQTVVASIACDPNVWNAVIQNSELQEFLRSQKTMEDSACSGSVTDSTDAELTPASGFMDVVHKIKTTVTDMMNRFSDFFSNFFGGLGAKASSYADWTAKITPENKMEASLLGLAVMVIMVILFKRA